MKALKNIILRIPFASSNILTYKIYISAGKCVGTMKKKKLLSCILC